MKLPGHKYMRLPQLYERLFRTSMLQEHDALIDAEATARCFFELQKRGDVDEQKIITQKQVYRPAPDAAVKDTYKQWPLLLVVLFILFVLILWLL